MTSCDKEPTLALHVLMQSLESSLEQKLGYIHLMTYYNGITWGYLLYKSSLII